MLNNISLKSRLSLLLVLVTLTSSFVIGVLGWTNGQSALTKSITNQLTSIRAAQAYNIELYFNQIFSQTRTLAEDQMIVTAMKQFQGGFEVGLYRSLSADQNAQVSDFYTNTFAKKLAENHTKPPLSILYHPTRTVASYFQYHYLIKNPFPLNEKDSLTESKTDSTIYNKFHRFYHPIFRNLANEFNYYDIFLIDIKSLNVNYSVFKEIDFGTSLKDGPHQDSGLGLLANRIQAKPTRGEVFISDFSSYIPSYGGPAAFVGSPIYDGNEPIGIIVIQLPAEEINRAMTYNENWTDNGLGKTGETYLVGEDRLMRSNSRRMIENQASFVKQLKETSFLPSTVNLANAFKTTNTIIPITSSSVTKAFDRQSGAHVTNNYLGKPVLSAYAPLNISGLNWAIISEISEKEAFAPVRQLQRSILIWGVVLILIVALLSMLISRYFVKPIEVLAEGVSQLRSGNDEVSVDLKSRDEFGELAKNFNAMVENIREKSLIIKRKTQENDTLLLNVMPEAVAERFRAGDIAADRLQQVSIAYVDIVGFSNLTTEMNTKKSALYLHDWVNQLDNLGDSYEVEKVKTLGSTYIAACGLTRTRLDHSGQLVDFAVATLKMLKRFNVEHETQLSIRVGIASGPVTSAVVGTRKFQYELWGEAVDIAARIRFEAALNTIVVTDNVKQKIIKTYSDFSSVKKLHFDDYQVNLYQLQFENISASTAVEDV